MKPVLNLLKRFSSTQYFPSLICLEDCDIFNLSKRTNFFKNTNSPLITQSDEKVEFFEEIKVDEELRFASVSMLFYLNQETESLSLVVCEKQNKDLEYKHAGTMVFPGGLIHDHETPLSACVRETKEEIFFSENFYMEIVNQVPKMHVNISNIDVFPYIGILRSNRKDQPSSHENDFDDDCICRELLEIGVKAENELSNAYLLNVKDLMRSYNPNGTTVDNKLTEYGPVFESDKQLFPQIWGATARILAHVFFTMEDAV